jgi:hypothetical protein
MKPHFAGLCATLALAAGLGACNKDAATAPTKTHQGPSMAPIADAVGGGGGSDPSHFVSNGDAASVNWFASPDGGFVFGTLNVSRGGSVTNPQAFLFYFIEQCDAFFSCNFNDGFGTIPARDLSSGDGKQLHLSTNTSSNPNFFTFGGPPGLITVDWAANGAFTGRTTGTSDQTFSAFRVHTTGISTLVSANTSGSVVGITIPPLSPGQFGANLNVTIDIAH